MGIEFRWSVDDGYVGGDRPQHLEFPDNELAVLDTEGQVKDYIEEVVNDDFQDRIGPSWKKSEEYRVIEHWKSLGKEKPQ